jgi:DNA repair protein RadC
MPPTSINLYTLKQVRVARYRYDIGACSVTNPRICHRLLQLALDLRTAAAEQFGIIALNAKYRVNGIHIIGVGGLDNVSVDPGAVFKAALLNNACAIICFHNHPSGDAEPSRGDILTTRRLQRAGRLLGIELVDHVITGERGYVSLKERGVL